MSLNTSVGRGWVHVILGGIFAMAMVGLTALEEYFGHPLSDAGVLFVVFQNVGLGLANSYYVSKVSLSATGLQETTSKQ